MPSDRLQVALLAEGVDRNPGAALSFSHTLVALLAEGVDRNLSDVQRNEVSPRRPPRGGRG